MAAEAETLAVYHVSTGVSRAIGRLARRQSAMPFEGYVAVLRVLASVPGSESEHLGLDKLEGLSFDDWRALGAVLVSARDGEDIAAALAALTVQGDQQANLTDHEVRIVAV